MTASSGHDRPAPRLHGVLRGCAAQLEQERLRLLERRRLLQHPQDLAPRRGRVAGRGERPRQLVARLERIGRIERDDRAPLAQRRAVIPRAVASSASLPCSATSYGEIQSSRSSGGARAGGIAELLAQLGLHHVRLPRRLVARRDARDLRDRLADDRRVGREPREVRAGELGPA